MKKALLCLIATSILLLTSCTSIKYVNNNDISAAPVVAPTNTTTLYNPTNNPSNNFGNENYIWDNWNIK